MLNMTLYKREMKGSLKMLIIFAAIISMYVSIIISMYDPEMMATLDSFYEVMPEVMASVGMRTGATSLIGFMISYLYGFILLIFPMVFCILRGNSLIAKYADKGSMVTLLAAPVKRRTVAVTQMSVLISGILLLMAYTTGLEAAIAGTSFPGELAIWELLKLNGALLCLHLFIGSICFLSSSDILPSSLFLTQTVSPQMREVPSSERWLYCSVPLPFTPRELPYSAGKIYIFRHAMFRFLPLMAAPGP